jgi:hypothetical protein
MNSHLMRIPTLWTLSKGKIHDLRYSKDTTFNEAEIKDSSLPVAIGYT